MADVIFHRSVKDFLEFNRVFLDRHYFLVYPLLEMIERSNEQEAKINAAFSIKDRDDLVIGIRMGPYLPLYSVSWNAALIEEIRHIIPFDKIGSDIFFSGTYELINELLDRSGRKYGEISAMNIYECLALRALVRPAVGKLDRACPEDVQRLADLSIQFQQSEYGDRIPHDRNHMLRNVVLPGIREGNIVKWTAADKIVSMAQVMTGEERKPLIGHFFTDPKERGKGYGTSMIWHLSHALLRDFPVCGLMTRQTNLVADGIFRKVGFEERYRWIKAAFV